MHEKTVYTANGIFVKISNYEHAINIGPLKLMHFNDIHLLFVPYNSTGVHVSQLYKVLHVYIGIWLEYYGMLELKGLISLKLFIQSI